MLLEESAEPTEFAYGLWAKSPPHGAEIQEAGYPLLPHLLDVAAVARTLLEAVPCPGAQPIDASWVSALVGLHDFGKASPGFQIKLGRSHIGSYRLERDQPDRHDASTAVLLTQQLKNDGLSQRSAASLSQAVAAHHGHALSSQELAGARWEVSPTWAHAHALLFRAVCDAVGTSDAPELPSDRSSCSAVLQWLMGLTTTADWVGSSDALCRWERLVDWNHDPQDWYQRSLQLAEEAVMRLGLRSPGLPAALNGLSAVQRVLGANRQPRPLQTAIADILDRLPEAPALLLIEGPMGEGKTEAALSCASGSRGIYLAMPTQATSNALFERLAKFLAAQPAQTSTYPIALAHGSGGTAPAEMRLREIGLGTADSSVHASEWFQGSKRCLLCAHGIGTVDQGLVGVLNTRHGFLRLFGLAGRTVIVDEVHAYDSYTGGLIERLIVWLQALGCRVVVMSATLPAARRRALLQAWAGCGSPEPSETPYPRVSWATTGFQQAVTFAASRRQHVIVEALAADTTRLCQQAHEWADHGARVLIVVNKVARAQAIYRQLDSPESTLFHARFPMEQRLKIESSVLRRFGPHGSARHGHVLVATQVAEQSLDIDFDVLISDPAPVDLVLQRLGRIHRHPRQRADGFEQPRLFIAGLAEEFPPEDLTKHVYSRWHVLRSVAWLRKHRELSLPDDIDRAVQEVYGDWEPVASAEFQAALERSRLEHEAEEAMMRSQAQQAAIRHPEEWRIGSSDGPLLNDGAAEAGALRFGTRLGEDSQLVVPLRPQDLEDLADRAAHLAGHQLRLSHPALIALARETPLPTGWCGLAVLSRLRPLLLGQQGQVENSPIAARLDPDLGLVIGAEP